LDLKNLFPNPIGVITSLFKKGLTENSYLIENDKSIFEFKILSPNTIAWSTGATVAAQRLRPNGCGPTVAAQRLQPNGYRSTVSLKKA